MIRLDRRALGILALFPAVSPARAAPRDFMARAFEMKRRAIAGGDQPYGAVLVRDNRIVGESPSLVVTTSDPSAHAEISAIRDAAKRAEILTGATIYSTAIPCAMCQTALKRSGVTRMIHGEAMIDAGAPVAQP